jgi:hypothetical protein
MVRIKIKYFPSGSMMNWMKKLIRASGLSSSGFTMPLYHKRDSRELSMIPIRKIYHLLNPMVRSGLRPFNILLHLEALILVQMAEVLFNLMYSA